MSPSLSAKGLELGFDGPSVITKLDLSLPAGAVTTIIGPNGCGKSTLLKGLARLLKPRAGQVFLGSTDVASLSQRHLAQSMAVLPQTPTAPAGLTVQELVIRGRSPRQRWFQQFSRGDESVVAQALADTGISHLADVPLDELSGGQRQRAWISMTLAQESETLLLDEPTTYLDLAHQVDVLELVRRLNRDHGRSVVMVLHDISLAARYSDHLVVIKEGAVVAEGTPAEVISEELLLEVFGLRARVVTEPVEGRPHVIPLGHPQVQIASSLTGGSVSEV